MKIIDFHTHLQPVHNGKLLVSEAEFLGGMDANGISVSCIFTLAGFQEPCEQENARLAEVARRHPRRLIPFATVDPKLGLGVVETLDRLLAGGVFRGVKLHPWLQAFAPTAMPEVMIPLLECAASHAVPVLFHDGTPPYSTTYQIAELARMVPSATIVLGHAGLGDYVNVAAYALRTIPNLLGCFCVPKAGDLAHLVNAAGEDRILWGSDFGFVCETLLKNRLEDVLSSGLPDSALEKIISTNAARLLRIQ